METRIIEAGQAAGGRDAFNWGKFLLGRPDDEWLRATAMNEPAHPLLAVSPVPLLSRCGWSTRHLWVLDLQTGEGAFFRPGGSAHADLEKHKIWVCPMFGPFLEWLYQQDLSDLAALPDLVELPDAPALLSGHRRPGPAPRTWLFGLTADEWLQLASAGPDSEVGPCCGEISELREYLAAIAGSQEGTVALFRDEMLAVYEATADEHGLRDDAAFPLLHRVLAGLRELAP
jgi:hypothetical protein